MRFTIEFKEATAPFQASDSWLGEGFFNCPPIIKSVFNSFPDKSCYPCPLGNAEASSIESNDTVSACIATLFFSICPMAIFWTIVSVVVNAIDTVRRRGARAHIGQEGTRVMPLITDFYISSTVVLVLWIVGVFAPLNHRSPCLVFRRVKLACSHCDTPISVAGLEGNAGDNPRCLRNLPYTVGAV